MTALREIDVEKRGTRFPADERGRVPPLTRTYSSWNHTLSFARSALASQVPTTQQQERPMHEFNFDRDRDGFKLEEHLTAVP